MAQVNKALKTVLIEEWGKVRRIDSDEGDTMRSCTVGTIAEDARNATFLRVSTNLFCIFVPPSNEKCHYEMLVDKNARRKKVAPEFELPTFYGQLEPIYRVYFDDAIPTLDIEGPTTYLFAAIRVCKVKPMPNDLQAPSLDINFYSGLAELDVVDITSVQSLIGRVPTTGGQWATVDRSGGLEHGARAVWAGDQLAQ
ncbi:hypothetical protein C8F04DRAFT_1393519 [Mycena alexandri]|uniref:Uncharacterized protein n=1 Tax=Mycena alexandri TaxID=1745969 RepID=A0AAD6T4D9_9AGAR|nr:hypothetical protein C8F04DRAFT_1393519 [Mycena alexandri]